MRRCAAGVPVSREADHHVNGEITICSNRDPGGPLTLGDLTDALEEMGYAPIYWQGDNPGLQPHRDYPLYAEKSGDSSRHLIKALVLSIRNGEYAEVERPKGSPRG